MYKKIMLIIIMLLSLVNCKVVSNPLMDSFFTDLNNYIETYSNNRFNNYFYRFVLSNDSTSLNGSISYDKISDGSHIQYSKGNNGTYNVIKYEDNEYYSYYYQDGLVNKEITSENEKLLYVNTDEIFAFKGKYENIYKTSTIYKFEIEYSKLIAKDKKYITTFINSKNIFDENQEYTFKNIILTYDFKNTDLSINLKIKLVSNNNHTTLNITLNYSCNEFEIFDFDGYVFEDEVNVVTSLNNATSNTDLSDKVYLANGDNYFKTSFIPGVYLIRNKDDDSYGIKGLSIYLFDSNKNPLITHIDPLLKEDSMVAASSFYIKDEGEYYININNSNNGHLTYLERYDVDGYPYEEIIELSNVTTTMFSPADFDTYLFKCDVNTAVNFSISGDYSLIIVSGNKKLSVLNGYPRQLFFEKGEHILFIKPHKNNEIYYPFEYSFKVDMISMDDVEYGNPVYGGIIKDYYEKSVIFQNNSHDNTKYLSYECKKDGYYKICYDILANFTDNENIGIEFRCEEFSSGGIYEKVENGYVYLNESKKYKFRIHFETFAEVKFKLEYIGENIKKD